MTVAIALMLMLAGSADCFVFAPAARLLPVSACNQNINPKSIAIHNVLQPTAPMNVFLAR
jgi:hypothetical protein